MVEQIKCSHSYSKLCKLSKCYIQGMDYYIIIKITDMKIIWQHEKTLMLH